jgi:hypothetical protein
MPLFIYRCPSTGYRPRPHRLSPQSSSISRFTAGAAGFLILSQWAMRPDR